jgi:hypothetical protein
MPWFIILYTCLINATQAQAIDSTGGQKLTGISTRVPQTITQYAPAGIPGPTGATGATGPAGPAATDTFWSIGLNNCTGTLYGPPNASFQLNASDASSSSSTGTHTLNSSGIFTWPVTHSGAGSGYVEIIYNGRAVTGASVGCYD